MAHDVYTARLREVRENYTANSKSVNVRIPKFLHEEWQRRKKKGAVAPLSHIVSHALHFTLYGPHPYANGLDGMVAAFDQYGTRDEDHDRMLITTLNKILELHGLPAKVVTIDPTS